MPSLKRKQKRPTPKAYYLADIYPLRNLLSASHHLSNGALKVARYILDNPKRAASMSIGQLAKATGSNKTAIVRLSKISGYQGFRGLRAALIENIGLVRATNMIGVDPPSGGASSDNPLDVAREVVKINVEVLQDTLTLLNEEALLRAANKILSAKQVLLVGFGTSAAVVQDAYQRFMYLQVPTSSCSDTYVLSSIVPKMGLNDLLFCVTYTGESRDIIEALETARLHGTPTISLTSAPRSAAALLSDIVLVSAARRTPVTGDRVAPRVAQFAIIDILCAILSLMK
jgi:DNA-binding MurR/RpiR family transcriptional regulator